MTTLFTIAVFAIEICSLFLLGVILFEYRHIHGKRVALLESLHYEHIKRLMRSRTIFSMLYVAFTFTLLVVSVLLYL